MLHTHTYIIIGQKQLMRRVCTLPYYKFSNRIFFPNYNKKIYIIKHQQHYYQIFNYYTSNTQYNNNSSSFVYKHNNIVTRSKSNNNNRSFNTNQEIRKTSFHQNIFTRTFFSSLFDNNNKKKKKNNSDDNNNNNMGNKNSRKKAKLSADVSVKDANSVTGVIVKNIKTIYTFEKELGSGHFGKCYLGQRIGDEVKAAIKVIRKRCLNERTVATLKNEVDILSKVSAHPNIAELFECLEDKSNLYLSMELCTGGELFDAIVGSPDYHFHSERQCASVIRDCLLAIDYCHDLGVVHRDIKPENLMLAVPPHDGQKYPPIKVIDFGLSRCYEEGKFMKRAVGTPYYIAPEVLKRHYGKECDIWSIGIILYVLLCGYPPFNAETDAEIHAKIKSDETHVFPEEDWKNVSKEVKDLINKCLERDTSKRITAKQALDHTWIKSLADDSTADFHAFTLSPKIFDRLKAFGQSNKFQKVAKRFIAESMHEDEIEELKKAFIEIDKDGSGTLTHDEIKTCIEKHLHEASSKSSSIAKEALRIMDINGDDQINYVEFVAATMEKKQWATVEHLHYAFDKLDRTRSGSLTRVELFEALGGEDVHLANEIMEKFDKNHDGVIDYDEFVNIMFALDGSVDDGKKVA